jgi:hypothetical protein
MGFRVFRSYAMTNVGSPLACAFAATLRSKDRTAASRLLQPTAQTVPVQFIAQMNSLTINRRGAIGLLKARAAAGSVESQILAGIIAVAV